MPVLLGVLTFAGVVSPAVHAAETEGPLLLVEHQLLGSGESQEVKGSAKTAFTFKSTSVKAKIECKALKLKSGATVIGSARKAGGSGKASLELSECHGGAKEEALTGCEPEGGKITSAALLVTVGYATETRTGAVRALFKPESGTTLATVKFSGEKCIAASATLSGRLIGDVFQNGKIVEVGTNEVESISPEIKFTTGEKQISTESEGSLSTVKSALTLFGVEATLEGAAALELTSVQPWGPFPIPELYGDGYYFPPKFLEFLELAGEVLAFTIEDVGSATLELTKLKISPAAGWELTDTNLCHLKTIITLGRCELTIKLTSATAGSAVLEGDVRYGGTVEEAFLTKALVN
ncbi:MAG TPA: hypothetical protein VK761_03250 [Solirubrobacteraceae bacterium]|nr:hypothetical protein [Solirubrobacteraceae bacterium]